MKKYKVHVCSLNGFVSVSLPKDPIFGENYLLTTVERLAELDIKIEETNAGYFIEISNKNLKTLLKDIEKIPF